jgi:hypothetical protein
VLGPGDDEHGSVVLSRECLDKRAQPDGECEGLVRVLTPERDEVL